MVFHLKSSLNGSSSQLPLPVLIIVLCRMNKSAILMSEPFPIKINRSLAITSVGAGLSHNNAELYTTVQDRK